jgi:hypothetical protein
MTPLTVRVEPADPRRTAAAAAALAALPASYAEVDGEADVVVVSGADGWALRVRDAASPGARGVIVTDPDPDHVPGAAVAGLLKDHPSCFVVLAETWASNPVLRAAREQFAAPIARTGLVDARAVEPVGGRSLRAALFAQLRAVQSLGVEVASLAVVAEPPSSILGVGRSASGARIVLSASRSETADGALDILLVASDETIRIEVPDSTTARPGRAVLTSAHAAVEVPTTWQTAHRAALLALRDALAAEAAPDHLESFARAIRLLGGDRNPR